MTCSIPSVPNADVSNVDLVTNTDISESNDNTVEAQSMIEVESKVSNNDSSIPSVAKQPEKKNSLLSLFLTKRKNILPSRGFVISKAGNELKKSPEKQRSLLTLFHGGRTNIVQRGMLKEKNISSMKFHSNRDKHENLFSDQLNSYCF